MQMITVCKKYFTIIIKSIAVFAPIAFLIVILIFGKPKFHFIFLYLFIYVLVFRFYYKKGKKANTKRSDTVRLSDDD